MYRWLAFASFTPLLLLALSSLFVLRRLWCDTILIWLFVCYYTALHMATIGSLRYRLPLEPLLLVLAATCLSVLIKEKSRKMVGTQSSNPSK